MIVFCVVYISQGVSCLVLVLCSYGRSIFLLPFRFLPLHLFSSPRSALRRAHHSRNLCDSRRLTTPIRLDNNRMTRLLWDNITSVRHVRLCSRASLHHHWLRHHRTGIGTSGVSVSSTHVRCHWHVRTAGAVHGLGHAGVLAKPGELEDGLGPSVGTTHGLGARGEGNENPKEDYI